MYKDVYYLTNNENDNICIASEETKRVQQFRENGKNVTIEHYRVHNGIYSDNGEFIENVTSDQVNISEKPTDSVVVKKNPRPKAFVTPKVTVEQQL